MFVWQQGGKHFAELPVYHLVFSKLSAMKFMPQGSDVIDDLSAAFGQVLGKRHVELREFLIEAVEFGIYFLFDIGKGFRGLFVQMLLDDARQKLIDPGKEVL